MFSTMINFNLLGLLRRLHKLQIKLELESISDNTGIIYPQQQAHKMKEGTNKTHIYSVADITNKHIKNALKCGLDRARNAMEELKMKDLLVEKKFWDKAFGDVGEVEKNDGEDIVEGSGDIKKDDTDRDEDIASAKDIITSHTVSQLDEHERKEIMEDLIDLEKEKVIDVAVKEKICKYMCKTSTSSSDDKTSISIYHPITHRTVSNKMIIC